jgi:hypothetical protein
MILWCWVLTHKTEFTEDAELPTLIEGNQDLLGKKSHFSVFLPKILGLFSIFASDLQYS